MKIKALTAAIILALSLTAVIIGQTLTTAQNSKARIDGIIERANDYFHKGMLRLKDGKREKARGEFDQAIDTILEGGVDVRSSQQLHRFYLELVDRIYREELTQSGFRHQGPPPFDSPSNDPLSKLTLTGDKRRTAHRQIARMDDLETSYDRFEDKTTAWVSYNRVDVKNLGHQNLRVAAFFTYRGKTVGRPVERIGLLFRSTTSEWTYLKSNHLIAIVDGQRLSVGGPMARDWKVSSNYDGAQVEEVLEFKIEYLELKKIAFARRVEMRLGPTEFDLHPRFLHSLKTLLSHLTLPPLSLPIKRRATAK